MHKRYLIRGSLMLLGLLVAGWLDPGSRAWAQSACEQELTAAEQAYTFGRFDEAIGLLNQCLDKRNVSSAERQRAYRLIGLSYIGKDVLNEARASVRRLLELVPDYRPDPDQDPPPFIEMVEEVRRELQREPVQGEPTRPTARREKKGISTWLLIGGGAVLAGVAAAVLLSGGGNGDGDGGTPPEPTTLDEQEPNSTEAQAQVLRGTPPITVRGNAALGDFNPATGLGFFNQGVLIDGFEDLYQFTISQAGVQVTLGGLSSDADLYLMGPVPLPQSFPFLGSSNGFGTQTESITLSTLAPGTYLIAVSISDDAPGQGLPPNTSYTLVIDGAVSGSNLRVAQEQIQSLGGAGATGDFRLMAHAGAEAMPLGAAFTHPTGSSWTAYHDEGGRLAEYDGTEAFQFRPGRGFWVQGRSAVLAPGTAASPSEAPDGAYAVSLHPGWNIIANPSDTPIDWAAVQTRNGVTQGLWRWDGHFSQASTFEPARRGEAYYFLNQGHREVLEVPRSAVSVSSNARRRSVLTLSAYREGRLASLVQAGFAGNAAPGLDGTDQFAPPGYFEAASLRLVRQVSTERQVGLAGEYRPWSDEGQRFDVVLEAPAHAPVELHADGLEAFTGYAVYLIDLEKSVVYDLHERSTVTLTSSLLQRRYALLIGDATFARAARDELAPEALSLSNYPNPFNPRTQIAYTVPATAANELVRLEVFDVTGQRVRLLIDGRQDPGTYRVEWDGTDAAGVPVASGVYLSRLQAGRHIQVRRMLLMK